jgi:hypothetical protein
LFNAEACLVGLLFVLWIKIAIFTKKYLAMYFTGIIIGVATFFIIGLFHPIVIKAEYYIGTRCWWVFALMGAVTVVAALFVENVLISTLLAVWGASSFWSIGELFEQRKRVERGWFPKRENRD